MQLHDLTLDDMDTLLAAVEECLQSPKARLIVVLKPTTSTVVAHVLGQYTVRGALARLGVDGSGWWRWLTTLVETLACREERRERLYCWEPWGKRAPPFDVPQIVARQ
jgi:hypothetical protein